MAFVNVEWCDCNRQKQQKKLKHTLLTAAFETLDDACAAVILSDTDVLNENVGLDTRGNMSAAADIVLETHVKITRHR